MSGVWAKCVRRGICECGYPVLEETVPLGKMYLVDPNTIRGRIGCGGCGKISPCELIEVWDEGAQRQATMVLGVLQLGEAA